MKSNDIVLLEKNYGGLLYHTTTVEQAYKIIIEKQFDLSSVE